MRVEVGRVLRVEVGRGVRVEVERGVRVEVGRGGEGRRSEGSEGRSRKLDYSLLWEGALNARHGRYIEGGDIRQRKEWY